MPPPSPRRLGHVLTDEEDRLSEDAIADAVVEDQDRLELYKQYAGLVQKIQDVCAAHGVSLPAIDVRSAVASSPQYTVWTGATLRGNEGVLPSLYMWLISTLDPCVRSLSATSKAVEQGLTGWRVTTIATWEGGTLAYITIRPDPSGMDGSELGVHAYGPDRQLLAERLADRIRAWDSGGHRGSVEPTVRAYPLATSEDQLSQGQVITNRYSRLVVSLP